MRIKRLDVPLTWTNTLYIDGEDELQELINLEGYNICTPIFKKEGWYLINNFISVVEFNNFSWMSFCPRIIESFKWELKILNHKHLSYNTVQALKTLARDRIISKEQQELLYLDNFIKSINQTYWRSLKCLNQ